MVALPFLCAAGLALVAEPAATIEIADRKIMLSDLAALAGTEDRVIAKFPDDKTEIEIDEETARRLIRNRIPNAQPQLEFTNRIILRAGPAPAPQRSCFSATVSIPAGEVVYAGDVELAQCEGKHAGLVEYDRDLRAFTAKTSIPAGSNLGPIRPSTTRREAKGRQAKLVTGSGAVTVSRTVTTLQPARQGENVFVRTTDNQVFAVPFERLAVTVSNDEEER